MTACTKNKKSGSSEHTTEFPCNFIRIETYKGKEDSIFNMPV
jgi:hypothetical protein